MDETVGPSFPPWCVCLTKVEQLRCQWYCLYVKPGETHTETWEDEFVEEPMDDRQGQLESAITFAISWFNEYKKHHLLKAGPEAMAKAARNRKRADWLRAVLNGQIGKAPE